MNPSDSESKFEEKLNAASEKYIYVHNNSTGGTKVFNSIIGRIDELYKEAATWSRKETLREVLEFLNQTVDQRCADKIKEYFRTS